MKLRIFVGELNYGQMEAIRKMVKDISIGFLGIPVSTRIHGNDLTVRGFYYESETESLITVLKDAYKLLGLTLVYDCQDEKD